MPAGPAGRAAGRPRIAASASSSTAGTLGGRRLVGGRCRGGGTCRVRRAGAPNYSVAQLTSCPSALQRGEKQRYHASPARWRRSTMGRSLGLGPTCPLTTRAFTTQPTSSGGWTSAMRRGGTRCEDQATAAVLLMLVEEPKRLSGKLEWPWWVVGEWRGPLLLSHTTPALLQWRPHPPGGLQPGGGGCLGHLPAAAGAALATARLPRVPAHLAALRLPGGRNPAGGAG